MVDAAGYSVLQPLSMLTNRKCSALQRNRTCLWDIDSERAAFDARLRRSEALRRRLGHSDAHRDDTPFLILRETMAFYSKRLYQLVALGFRG